MTGRPGRRNALRWLAGAATLALGPGLPGLFRAAEAGPPASFPFRPGPPPEGPLARWPVRTVDPQDLPTLLAGWRLRVGGLVETPLTFSFADLLELPRTDQTADLHCVEGWSVLDIPWSGVRAAAVLDAAGVRREATHVTIRTFGGRYDESLPLAVAREPRTLLAYGAAGATLPLEHGFPLRLAVPRLLGYKNAKYVSGLELTDRPVKGFWVAGGYDYGGEVPAGRLRAGRY